MPEQLTDNPGSNSRGVLSGIAITLFSAFISAMFFALFFSLAFYKKMPYGKPQAIILQVAAALVAVGMTQFLSRKIQGDRLTFIQAFLGGWLSSLVLGMMISFFYTVFFRITEVQVMPKGAFAMILMLFSLLGLIISLLLSFIFKK